MTTRKSRTSSVEYIALLLLGIFLAQNTSAAPAVSSVSGTVSNGNTLTISGSGFGTNTVAQEWTGGNIEAGSIGQLFSKARWSEMDSWSSVYYASDQSHSGTKSLKVIVNPEDNWNGLFTYNFATPISPGGTGYLTWWVRVGASTAAGQWKMLRLSQTDTISDGPQEFVLFNWNDASGSQKVIDPGTSNDQTEWNSVGFPKSNGLWQRAELFITASNSNQTNGSNTIGLYNGSIYTASTWSGTRNFTASGQQYNYALFQNYMGNGISGNVPVWFDDILIQNGVARVELCDVSSWSGRRRCEIQPSASWSASSVGAVFNQGSFTSGATAYLYVIDSTGAVNSTGYPITIGSGGGGDTTPPTSPTNLAATSSSQSSISVSWTASTDAVGVTSYIVERCQGTGCSNFAQVGTPTASPFVDSGLTANTFYNYHVRARDAANNLSGWSNVVGATTQASTPVTELIIDNTDTNTSQSGSWSPSTNFPGYYGTDYHYSPNATGHWFEWTTTNLVAGTYEVYAYWNANTDRPTDVSYLITHSGGTVTRNNINQTQNGSQWNLLGTYAFGTTGTVRVQSGGTGTEGTVADAIRFVKTTTTPCNTVTASNFSQAAYNSYGAPFDAFQTSTNLVNTQCDSADTHTINITTGITGDTTRIIYTRGYWYDAVTTTWRQYTGTCTGALNGEWCQGSVSATITDPNVSTASSASPTYLVGMTCSVQGGSWKCGCRDTSCTNFSWQIQGAGQ